MNLYKDSDHGTIIWKTDIISNTEEENDSVEQTMNIFDNRIDDCSKTKWIPYFDLKIESKLFADLVSIKNLQFHFVIDPF